MNYREIYNGIVNTVGKNKIQLFFEDKLENYKSQLKTKFKEDENYLFLKLSGAILTAQAKWGNDYEDKMNKLETVFPIGSPFEILKLFEGKAFYEGIKYIDDKVEEYRSKVPVQSMLLKNHIQFITLNAFLIYEDRSTTLLKMITSLRDKCPDVLTIAENISAGEYKLKGVGLPIAMEFLKSIGMNAFKPDTLIKRLFSKERLEILGKNNGDKFVFKKAQEFLNSIKPEFLIDFPVINGRELTALDNLLWAYCTENVFGVCKKTPDCSRCQVKVCNQKRE